MTERQMQAILDLVEEFERRQIVIINRLEAEKNKELSVLDKQFEDELKNILDKEE